MANYSQYGQPAQAQFINTYVPLPMNQILGMVAQKQNRYAQGAGQLAQEQGIIQSIQAPPGSADEEYLNNINKQVVQLVNDYADKDLSDVVTVSDFHNKLNSMVDKQYLGRIANSYKNWLKNQQFKEQLMLRNEYNPLIDKDPVKGWDSRQGVYNYITPSYIPKEQVLDRYFDELTQPRVLEELGTDKYGRYKIGITQKDVDAVVSGNANEWLATPSGQHEVDIFKQQFPEQAQGLSDLDIVKKIMNKYGERYKKVYRYTSEVKNQSPPFINPNGLKDLTPLKNYGTKQTNNYKSGKDVVEAANEAKQAVDQITAIPEKQRTAEDKQKLAEAQAKYDDLYNGIIGPIQKNYKPQFDSIAKTTEANIINELVTKAGKTPEEAKKILDEYNNNVGVQRRRRLGALFSETEKLASKLYNTGFGLAILAPLIADAAGINPLTGDMEVGLEHTKNYLNVVGEIVDKKHGAGISEIIRSNVNKATEANNILTQQMNQEIADAANVNMSDKAGILEGYRVSGNDLYRVDEAGHRQPTPLNKQFFNAVLNPEDQEIVISIDDKDYTSDKMDKMAKKGISKTELASNISSATFDWHLTDKSDKPGFTLNTSYKDKNNSIKDAKITMPITPEMYKPLYDNLLDTRQYQNLAALEAWRSGLRDLLWKTDIAPDKLDEFRLGNIPFVIDEKAGTTIPAMVQITRDKQTGDIMFRVNDEGVMKTLGYPLDEEGFIHVKDRPSFVAQVLNIYMSLKQQQYKNYDMQMRAMEMYDKRVNRSR